MDPQRRPQLPALSYLADCDKVKREDDVVYQNRHTGTGPPQSLSLGAGASPTYHYPQGPPPPYSHAHGVPPTNSWSKHAGAHTPTESRRTSENEKEGTKQMQSLPSISEALGIDRQNPVATDPPPNLPPSGLAHTQTTAACSPSPNTRRSHLMEPLQPAQPPYSTAGGAFPQYSRYRSEPQQSTCPPLPETSRPAPVAYPPVSETKPAPELHASQPTSRPPPQATPLARPTEPSPVYEQPTSTSAGSMGPPSSFTYAYTSYPPRYANPTPPSSASSGSIYQPSVYSAPQSAQPKWKTADRADDRLSGSSNYGDSVKRHLDFYDLESALTEIAATSGILSDFSRRYGDRMHQTQRSGATLNTLPGIVEIDDMISKSRVAHECLMKIRDVVLQQQAAEQQAADQRQQHKVLDQHPAQTEHHEPPIDEGKPGGFAGVDTKKRRGRAAPPGRCHSCNRAETPEWRRGPDGARTLCNACGLHYAKLTRKNNGTNKNASVGSSNLRPKENMAP